MTAGDNREPDDDELMRIVDEKYEGDPTRLTNLASSSITFDSLDKVYKALTMLGEQHEVVDYEDTFAEPKKSGYGDIRVKIRMSNGRIGEIRLLLASMERVAETERALYEVRRDLRRKANAEGRDLTPREEALNAELVSGVAEEYRQAVEEGSR